MKVPGSYYLVVAAAMFCIGAIGLLIRRNALVMFMCVELMLNAVNLTFVTFARMLDDINGQVLVFFTLVAGAIRVVQALERAKPLPAGALAQAQAVAGLLQVVGVSVEVVVD